jgi:hypothetical protein
VAARLSLAVVALAWLAVACTSTTTSPAPNGSPATASTSEAPPEEDQAPVDTSNLTAYTEAEVQALFDTKCVKCHDSSSANVDLSAPFTKSTIGVATGGPTGKTICGRGSDVALRIKPGDRAGSLLWHKVKRTQDCGSPMPYDRGNKPLDATQLERLGLYIDQMAD